MAVSLEPLDTRSRFEAALPPATRTASEDGPAVDLLDCDGPVRALVLVGDLGDEMTLDVSFQESATGAAWTAVAGGGVSGISADGVALHSFARTKRFLRCRLTLTGDAPTATLGVLVGQAVKVF